MKVKAQVAMYTLVNDTLYRQSFFNSYQRCVPLNKAKQIIEQVHGGMCSTHIGGKLLCYRIMTRGFYWPTMKQESKMFKRNCNVCQNFDNIIHTLATTLHSLSSPWLFYKWGINIVGLLSLAIGQRKFIMVATNYFTDWAEVEAYT